MPLICDIHNDEKAENTYGKEIARQAGELERLQKVFDKHHKVVF